MNESPLFEGGLRNVFLGFVPNAFTLAYTYVGAPNSRCKVVGLVATNTGVVNCNLSIAIRASGGVLGAAEWNKIDTFPMLGKETIWFADEFTPLYMNNGASIDMAASIASAITLMVSVREVM